MSRKLIIASWISSLLFIVGCQMEEVAKDDPRFRVDPTQAAMVTNKGYGVPDATEVDLVEQLVEARQIYRQRLEELLKYYRAAGNATNRQWAEHELTALDRVPHYRYLMPAEFLKPDLMAVDVIDDADILFNDAMKLYQEAGGLLIITDEDKLRGALNKFNQLIVDYPSSNKIDDAAYRAGRIYEYFKDYQIASVYSQRCFQWNDLTQYPARFRAAYVLDQRLHMRTEALTLYQLAVERESRYAANTEFAQKRILEMTRPMVEPFAPGTTTAPSGAAGAAQPDTSTEVLDNVP
jgi:hypothetical protein